MKEEGKTRGRKCSVAVLFGSIYTEMLLTCQVCIW